MHMSPDAALALLPFALVIGLWVAWSDLKFMKIPNKAVIALTISFAVVGVLVLPFGEFAWRWLHLAVVLVVGFLLNMARALGAGDAKYAAAMAPFIATGDIARFMMLFAAVLFLSFFLHRILRMIAPLRNATADWESWTNAKFPMGLALGPSLAFYLAIAAFGA